MSEAEKFMHWMIKIQNIHYTNDNRMSKALENFNKPKQYVDTTPGAKID